MNDKARHWDDAYEQGDTTRSWFQKRPAVSLEMFDKSAAAATDSVIDIGGGAATLVDELLARRFEDLTVLDISPLGLGHSQSRLGADAARVTWLVADILEWEPQRSYRAWHDRAVFTSSPPKPTNSDTSTPSTKPPPQAQQRSSGASPPTDRNTAPGYQSPATSQPTSPNVSDPAGNSSPTPTRNTPRQVTPPNHSPGARYDVSPDSPDAPTNRPSVILALRVKTVRACRRMDSKRAYLHIPMHRMQGAPP